jgi:CubicO group peptidase (beta-lactamase class C family)
MKQLLAIVAVLALMVGVNAVPPASLTTQGSSALSTFLGDAVARGDVPGVVALVVDRDKVLYHEAFGKMNVAKNAPMAKDTIFRIASMTKAVTSVGVMQLVEQGKLGLDDEVSKYLPRLKSPQVFSTVDEQAGTYVTQPAKRPITIRQLLTHTSGVGYSWSDHGLAIAQKKTGATNDSELPLVNEPGAQWTYGASTRVLGEVIEKITGERIDAYLETHIFVPLGMRDTSYTVPPAKYSRVVTVHQRANNAITETQNPTPIPATIRGDGGLFSTHPTTAGCPDGPQSWSARRRADSQGEHGRRDVEEPDRQRQGSPPAHCGSAALETVSARRRRGRLGTRLSDRRTEDAESVDAQPGQSELGGDQQHVLLD